MIQIVKPSANWQNKNKNDNLQIFKKHANFGLAYKYIIKLIENLKYPFITYEHSMLYLSDLAIWLLILE